MYDLFERRVIGIYKPDCSSRSVTLDPRKYHEASGPTPSASKSKDRTKAQDSLKTAFLSRKSEDMQFPMRLTPVLSSNLAQRRSLPKHSDNNADSSSICSSLVDSVFEAEETAPDPQRSGPETQSRVSETLERTPDCLPETEPQAEEQPEKETGKSMKRRSPKSRGSASSESQEKQRSSKRQKSGSSNTPAICWVLKEEGFFFVIHIVYTYFQIESTFLIPWMW